MEDYNLERILDIGLIFNKLKNEYLSPGDILNLCQTSKTICEIISSYSTKFSIHVPVDYFSYSFRNPSLPGPYPFFARSDPVTHEEPTFKLILQKERKTLFIKLGTLNDDIEVNNRILNYRETLLNDTFAKIQFTSCKKKYFEHLMKILCASKSLYIKAIENLPLHIVVEYFIQRDQNNTVSFQYFESLKSIEYDLDGISELKIFNETIADKLVVGLKDCKEPILKLNWRLPHREIRLETAGETIQDIFAWFFNKCTLYNVAVSLAVNISVLKYICKAHYMYPAKIVFLKLYNYSEKDEELKSVLGLNLDFFENIKYYVINFSSPPDDNIILTGMGAKNNMASIDIMKINFCNTYGHVNGQFDIVQHVPTNLKHIFLNGFTTFTPSIINKLSIGSAELRTLVIDSNSDINIESLPKNIFVSFKKLNTLRHECSRDSFIYPETLNVLVIRCSRNYQTCNCGSFSQENLSFRHHTMFLVDCNIDLHIYHNSFEHVLNYLKMDVNLISNNL
uniref:F-box domain-containing protein n=1 Tax=Parastrongyloides trichosuri TaxID=131310 RepID=A0A0N4ZQB9_PARTI